jgi:hypothetical protein
MFSQNDRSAPSGFLANCSAAIAPASPPCVRREFYAVKAVNGNLWIAIARVPPGVIVRKTIGAVFLETASRLGERVAILDREQDVRLTWAEYAHQAMRTAAGFGPLACVPATALGSGQGTASSGSCSSLVAPWLKSCW